MASGIDSFRPREGGVVRPAGIDYDALFGSFRPREGGVVRRELCALAGIDYGFRPREGGVVRPQELVGVFRTLPYAAARRVRGMRAPHALKEYCLLVGRLVIKMLCESLGKRRLSASEKDGSHLFCCYHNIS